MALKIGGGDVEGLLPAVQAVRRTRPGSALVMRIRRGGQEQNVTIKVGVLPFAAAASLDGRAWGTVRVAAGSGRGRRAG